jgi:hypothetical protein
VIQREWRRLVADRGLDGFAADDPLHTHVPHQSRYGATGNIEAFALELAPDLAHTVDGEVPIEDATNSDRSERHPAWRADRLAGSRRLATWAW